MAGLAGNKVADDVMIEILSRLPPKSLVRFECISKSWAEITGDRYLMARHHQKVRRAAPKSCIFTKSGPDFRLRGFSLLGEDHSFADIRLPKQRKRGTDIEASGDGILYVSRDSNSEDDYLWNPCIRQFKSVPPFHPKTPADDTPRDGMRPSSYYGVGLDPKSNRVKVVRTRTYPLIGTLADVWTVGDPHGREIHSVPLFPPKILGNLYINGKCYWTGWDRDTSTQLSFLCFDMATEKFECLPLPAELAHRQPVMGQLKESVAFFAFRHRGGFCEVDIWLMNKHTCWSKYKSITIKLMSNHCLFPLGFCNDREVVFRSKTNYFLCFHNVETGETTFVKNGFYVTSICFYTESILSIQGRKYEHAVINRDLSSPLV